MKRNIKLLLLGISGFFVFLLATFPAEYAYQYVQTRIKPMYLSNLGGTVWTGSAGAVQYQSEHLGELNWSLHPHNIIRGYLETDFSLNANQLQTKGTVGKEFFGTAYAKNMEGHLSAAFFGKHIGIKTFIPTGKLHFSMQRMEFSPKGRLESAVGNIMWEQAGISSPAQVILGNLNILVSTEKEGIVFNISDENSPIKIEAHLLVCPDGKYELNGKLTPTLAAQKGFGKSLAMLGKPDKKGVIKIKYAGRLK